MRKLFEKRLVWTTATSLLFVNTCLAQTTNPEISQTGGFWLWHFLGRLHPLTVHFPVALLVVAAILELFTLKKFHSSLRPGIKVLVITGTISALVSVIFGLMLSRDGDYGAQLLNLHMWTAIVTTILGGLAWLLLSGIMKTNKQSQVKSYRAVLFLSTLGVSIAGHLGASLTHGSDYLTATLPWSKDYAPGKPAGFDITALQKDSAKLTKKQEAELNVQVRTILAHNCYKCHGSEKVKGELRLDSKDFVFKGGENGPVILAGNPQESELIKRISLPADHKDVMPSKGKKLSQDEIAVINFWISKGAPWPEGDDAKNVFRVAALAPRNPSLPQASGNITNPIDLWTNQYFVTNNIAWPKPVEDRIFLKRVYLDIIGLLPSPEEIQAFDKDNRADKRALKIRELVNREDDYAQHWLTFWNDALRNDYTGTGYITNGRYAITDWLYNAIKINKPYDQFVKELINFTKESRGFIEGIKWRGVVNASQRTEMQAAQNVSQVFFGLNLKCTSCHNSFISDWKLDDAYAFANIFADSSLEINRCDKPTGKYTNARILWSSLGSIDSSAPASTKRAQLAEVITRPENGRLYRTFVNRIWAQLLGRGLVEPVDVMDNEPWSQDLLDWLAFNFQQNNSNTKELIFLIATSNTYQLPSKGFKDPEKIIASDYHFAGPARKRMSAEQFSDAVGSVIGPLFPDSLVKYRPKAPPVYDAASRLFNRASLVMNNSFLTALGRPNRETVSTSRESQANLLQALEFTNGDRFNSTLKTGAEKWKSKYKTSDAIIREIYKRALGRNVQPAEYQTAKKVLGDNPGTDTIQDFFWSVMLLPEFQIIY